MEDKKNEKEEAMEVEETGICNIGALSDLAQLIDDLDQVTKELCIEFVPNINFDDYTSFKTEEKISDTEDVVSLISVKLKAIVTKLEVKDGF